MFKKKTRFMILSFLLIISMFVPKASRNISFADEEKKNVYFVGDDTVVGMSDVVPQKEEFNNYIFVAENQKGLTWLEEVNKKIIDEIGEGDTVVFSIGFSEISNPFKVEGYARAINEFASNKKIVEKKVKVYTTNLLPINDSKYISLSNEKIVEWNNALKMNISKDVHFLDIYNEFETKIETLNDGYHYTNDTYKNVLDYILNKIGRPTITEIEQDKDKKELKQEVGKNSWGTDSFGYKVYYNENSEIVRKQFKGVNGATYYFDKDGHYVTGVQKIDNQTFFFNELGMMKKDEVTKVDKDHMMAFDKDGKALKPGWHVIDENDYYVGKDGYILTGWWTLGTNDHYFKEDGKAAKGIEVVDGDTYFFEDKGKIRVGWVEQDGEKYYFEEGGPMATGLTEIEGKIYYFDNVGKMARGFKEFPAGKRYFDPETGEMLKGKVEIDKKNHYFDDNGFLLQGWQKNAEGKFYYDENGQRFVGLQKINGKLYFFDEKGIMQTGLVEINNKYKFFDLETGEMLVDGIKEVNGKKYMFDENGDAVTGVIIKDGKIYKIDDTGEIKLTIPMFLIALIIIIPIVIIMGKKLFNKAKEIAESEEDDPYDF